jgi:hypothetical protein
MKKYLILFVVIVFVSALFGCSVLKKAKDRVSVSNLSRMTKSSDSKSFDPDTMPKVFSDPPGKFFDKDLTISKISMMFVRDYPDVPTKCVKVLKIHISKGGGPENDWRISKDDWGRPEYKYTYRTISVIWKAKDGNCYFDEWSTCKRKFDGVKYGHLYCVPGMRFKKINCDVVK